MPYAYGSAPIHADYPVPLDDTPLDAESWGHLVDRIGVGSIVNVASQTEQDDYLAAVTLAYGPPSPDMYMRVCRTDLDGLVLVHAGIGWRREFGGSFEKQAFVQASSGEELATGVRPLGALTTDLPFPAKLAVTADVLVKPTNPVSGWHFAIQLQDKDGVRLQGYREYQRYNIASFNAQIAATVNMSAGPNRVVFAAQIIPGSTSVQWMNVNMSAAYA